MPESKDLTVEEITEEIRRRRIEARSKANRTISSTDAMVWITLDELQEWIEMRQKGMA
jgi:hypothetical protein